MSIITREIKEACACKRCKGTGESDTTSKYCKLCSGTGIYSEQYSFYINDAKGIAFGGEPGQ
jgi:DnaJ-class molecular chaperone